MLAVAVGSDSPVFCTVFPVPPGTQTSSSSWVSNRAGWQAWLLRNAVLHQPLMRAFARCPQLLHKRRPTHLTRIPFAGLCLLPPALITEYCARVSLFDCLRAASTDPAIAAQLTWQRRLAMVGGGCNMLRCSLQPAAPISFHADMLLLCWPRLLTPPPAWCTCMAATLCTETVSRLRVEAKCASHSAATRGSKDCLPTLSLTLCRPVCPRLPQSRVQTTWWMSTGA